MKRVKIRKGRKETKKKDQLVVVSVFESLITTFVSSERQVITDSLNKVIKAIK